MTYFENDDWAKLPYLLYLHIAKHMHINVIQVSHSIKHSLTSNDILLFLYEKVKKLRIIFYERARHHNINSNNLLVNVWIECNHKTKQ